uniref:UBA-like domain containing 1b n=1 Tax=Neogobius melanostomus TaxID=47308 RepID=A0A8C6WFK9_9GOBI
MKLPTAANRRRKAEPETGPRQLDSRWPLTDPLLELLRGSGHQAKQATGMEMCTPANTPATPPNFPDALTMFSRLKASESFNSGSGGSSMAAAMATSPPVPQGWGMSAGVSAPQPAQGLWTQGQPPTQPCAAWPTPVNPHTGQEQKASVVMEAER